MLTGVGSSCVLCVSREGCHDLFSGSSDLFHAIVCEAVTSLGLLQVLHLYSFQGFQGREARESSFPLFTRHLLARFNAPGEQQDQFSF